MSSDHWRRLLLVVSGLALDIYAGVISAMLVAVIAARVAPSVDRWLSGSATIQPSASP